MQRCRNALGFTMVEMLATIAIMGILAGIATLGVARLRNSADAEYCESVAEEVRLASSAYVAAKGGPATGADSTARMQELHGTGFLRFDPDPQREPPAEQTKVLGSITLQTTGRVDNTCR